MSVCDPQNPDTACGSATAGGIVRPGIAKAADGERDEMDMVPFARLMAAHRREIAAVILEPIVRQAAWMYHPSGCRCKRDPAILLIADEIATGFFAPGKLFACG